MSNSSNFLKYLNSQRTAVVGVAIIPQTTDFLLAGINAGLGSVAYDSTDHIAWVLGSLDGLLHGFDIDSSTFTLVSPEPTLSSQWGVTYNPIDNTIVSAGQYDYILETWDAATGIRTDIVDGSLVIGQNYYIVNAGSSYFTTIGSGDNVGGTVFTATGTTTTGGPFDGTVQRALGYQVASNQVYFYSPPPLYLPVNGLNPAVIVVAEEGPGTAGLEKFDATTGLSIGYITISGDYQITSSNLAYDSYNNVIWVGTNEPDIIGGYRDTGVFFNSIFQTGTVTCLAYDPVNKRIWVADTNSKLRLFDAVSLTQYSEFTLPTIAMDIKYDSTQFLMWISLNNATVAAYDLSATMQVTYPLPSPTGSFSCAYDVVDNVLWATSTNYSSNTDYLTKIHAAIIPPTPPIALSVNDRVLIDSSLGPVALTLPPTPELGDEVVVTDATGHFATNNVTVQRNGEKIMGLAQDLTISTNNATVTLVYYDSTNGWRII